MKSLKYKKNNNESKEIKKSLKKYKTQKLISKYKLDENKYLLFYTDARNLSYILKNGINIVSDINLKNDENYIIWAYSQLYDQVQLECINSNHNNFWLWSSNQEIELKDVSVIAINFNLLFNNCKKNWKYNNITSTISVFETIMPSSFEWIMIKNKQYKKELESILKEQKIDNIKIFYSINGSVNI